VEPWTFGRTHSFTHSRTVLSLTMGGLVTCQLFFFGSMGQRFSNYFHTHTITEQQSIQSTWVAHFLHSTTVPSIKIKGLLCCTLMWEGGGGSQINCKETKLILQNSVYSAEHWHNAQYNCFIHTSEGYENINRSEYALSTNMGGGGATSSCPMHPESTCKLFYPQFLISYIKKINLLH
jgi:hypothetical protein